MPFFKDVHTLSKKSDDESAQLLQKLLEQGRNVLDESDLKIWGLPFYDEPTKTQFGKKSDNPYDHFSFFPPYKGGFKKNWDNLINRGADPQKLHEFIIQHPLPHISEILKIQEQAEKISKKILKSERHYNSLKKWVLNDKGLSSTVRDSIEKEIEENIRVLEFIKPRYSYSRSLELTKSIGLDKGKNIKPVKHKAWSKAVLDLVTYSNQFLHTPNCDRSCKTIHQKTFECVAIFF